MKELLLTKPYYGKYSHRVEIRHYELTPKTKKPSKKWINSQGIHDGIAKFVEKNIQGEFRTRHNGYFGETRTAIFFSDESFVDKVKEKYGDKILSIEKPKSEAHLQAVSKEKYVARKTLFYNKFRYRFHTNCTTYYWSWYSNNTAMQDKKKEWEEVKDWLASYMKNLGRKEGEDWMINTTGWSPVVFMAHANDANMFKLTWSEKIKNFQRVKLHDELD